MTKRMSILIACLAVPILTIPAVGQWQANNGLYSGGANTARPGYQPNTGNRIVSGNVTSGAGFRAYSPIRDPNSFFLGSGSTGGSNLNIINRGATGYLPSDSLTTFRRDSVGVNQVVQNQALPSMTPAPYYARSSTVANTGMIVSGLNQPGTSQLQSPYTPIQANPYARMATPQEPRNSLIGTPINGEQNGTQATITGNPLTGATVSTEAIPGTINARLLRSPLFGGARVVPGQAAPNQPGQETSTPDVAGTADLAQRRLAQSALVNPSDRTAMDRLLGQQAAGAQETRQAAQDLRSDTDANRRLSRPIGAQEQPEQTAGLARPLRAAELAQGGQAMRRGQVEVPNEPLSTFTGTADERLKGHLTEAERLLREQRYYDAARRYEMAHAVDMKNPLPLFGRSMSLLAAGDYVSSANDLFMAIQSAGPSGAVKVNLQQFIPDLQVLDKRRAFLEQQLDVYDDFRLRFLLGWAEYMSDMAKPGLENMQKAAQAAPKSMDAVRQFVDMLATKQAAEPAAPAARPG